MTQEELLSKLKTIIAPYLPEDVSLDDVSINSHFINELNINSANLVDVVLDVEDEFDIEIDNDAMEKMLTVKASIEVIEGKLAAK
ncbi:phosphopantetheine-binding protein [Aquimarina sp. MMG016]|uniref:acyl carrier protein n=1 Tax=Aquimarina sp. MMG016 TaxID=2822690 RepID=UPI001B39D8A3|nr:phosphopantetheine-binding protein [Aquimarina sp. MMG016]MBQ4819467.1 acyl carrier protein [Aquimarina sp. MMG016]